MIRSLNRVAVRNIGEARLRTGLSILVVMLSVAMVIATDGFANAMQNALPGADSGQSMGSFALNTLNILFKVINAVIIAVAGFLIFNAFMMSVTERRQQIGMLRSLGMTRKQVMKMVVTEGLVIGGIGTALGLLVGPLMAHGMAGLLLRFGGGMFTVIGDISFSIVALVVAAVLGIFMTLFSTLIPAYNATRISPLSALRRQSAGGIEAITRWRVGLALLLAVLLLVYLRIAPPGEWVLPPQDSILSGVFIMIWLVAIVFMLPAVLEVVGIGSRKILGTRWLATGRLLTDNLRRERARVILTVLTLTVGLTMIVGMTGMSQFLFHKLTIDVIRERTERTTYAVVPFDFNMGLAAFASENLQIPEDVIEAMDAEMEGIADTLVLKLAFVQELNPLVGDSFSYVIPPEALRLTGDLMFAFSEGDSETAFAQMQEGCAVLAAPAVAAKNGVEMGEPFMVQGKDGLVECRIVGLGTTIGWSSVISESASDLFDVTPPFELVVVPRVGVDTQEVLQKLEQIVADNPGLFVIELGDLVTSMEEMTRSMTGSMNAILVLAILAAALGVINTTMMNIHERQSELGLLRAIGATRAQVRTIIMGEAAIVGLVGGIIGLIAGLGMAIIFVVTYGGNAFGIEIPDLWGTAFEVIQPALLTGVVGVLVAPIISALAAWIPTRSILKGAPIETMDSVRH